MFAPGDQADDKYRVLGRLGSGGFGEVWLAEDETIPGRRLALKVLNAAKAADEDELVREMQVLARFDHPGVVGFRHHFRHQGRLVLVMAYCAGGSLEDRLAAGYRATVDEAFRWGAVLCETLAAVHAQGIVHHDIKPANILFGQDGAILPGDFGVANRNTGTVPYLPPEMLRGEVVSRLDARVDVYALGLTLGESIAGELPFERQPRDQWLPAKAAHETVPPGLPRWAQEVLLRATHPTPEQRFQTMHDFADAIRARHVPHVIDARRLKAHAMAERAEAQLRRKKWKPALRAAEQALVLDPGNTAALLAAGRCHLLLRRTEQARDLFTRALAVNPRIHVQKELGWLNLEQGHVPLAISLLSDHLDRDGSDEEACNLLLKCYWVSGRYEPGVALAQMLIDAKSKNGCFANNLFLCQLLDGGVSAARLRGMRVDAKAEPLLACNLTVAREQPSSWSAEGGPLLKDKLLFQEYRFLPAGHGPVIPHTLALRVDGEPFQEVTASVITFGSLGANDIVLSAPDVSRRHAAVVNLAGEVWLYDLRSARGTKVDGEAVSGRRFLDGVHTITLGSRRFELGARTDLLV